MYLPAAMQLLFPAGGSFSMTIMHLQLSQHLNCWLLNARAQLLAARSAKTPQYFRMSDRGLKALASLSSS